MDAREKIIVALDHPDPKENLALLRHLEPEVKKVKVGSILYGAGGRKIVQEIADRGLGIFLDLKLHDIPSTVAKTVRALSDLPALQLLTLHALGGEGMIRDVRKEVESISTAKNLRLLAVTILTSMQSSDLFSIGLKEESIEAHVANLAKAAWEAGAHGLVCSPKEVAALRASLGSDPLLVVPGIRPAGSAANDQKRIATPKQAIDSGASYLVIGRPISADADPRGAFLRICEEIEA